MFLKLLQDAGTLLQRYNLVYVYGASPMFIIPGNTKVSWTLAGKIDNPRDSLWGYFSRTSFALPVIQCQLCASFEVFLHTGGQC